MSKIRFFVSLFCVVIAGGIAVSPHAALAIGVSPALLEVNNVTPNSSVKKSVMFSRANPSVDLEARVSVSGNGVAAIRLNDDGRALLPKGQEQVPYEFVIEPKRYAAGTYEVKLKVVPENVKEEGESGTKVLSGAESIVRFTVTKEDVKSYLVSNVMISDIIENETISLAYMMTNDGNVDARPSRIEVTLTNEFDESKTYSATLQDSELPLTRAFTEETVEADTTIALPIGLYSAAVAVFRGDEKIYSFENVRMQVTNADGKVPESAMKKDKSSHESFLLAFGSLLAFLFLVIGSAAIRLYRKKR